MLDWWYKVYAYLEDGIEYNAKTSVDKFAVVVIMLLFMILTGVILPILLLASVLLTGFIIATMKFYVFLFIIPFVLFCLYRTFKVSR